MGDINKGVAHKKRGSEVCTIVRTSKYSTVHKRARSRLKDRLHKICTIVHIQELNQCLDSLTDESIDVRRLWRTLPPSLHISLKSCLCPDFAPLLVWTQQNQHTVKLHFVTIKHVVMSFKLQFYFQQLLFIFKIIKHWLLFQIPMLPFENLVFESF